MFGTRGGGRRRNAGEDGRGLLWVGPAAAGLVGLAASGAAASSGAIAVAVGAGAVTAADRGARGHRDVDVSVLAPRIDPAAFNRALARADLDRDARATVQLLHADYGRELEGLAADLDAAERAAGRDRLDDHLGGRIRLDASELGAIHLALAEARVATWGPAADELVGFLDSLEFFVAGPAVARIQNEIPALRRAAFLGPIAEAGGPRLEAGETADLVALVTEAADAELRGVAPERLAAITAGWAASVDPVLPVAARDAWRARVELRGARSAGDEDRVLDAERRLVEAWERLQAPLASAVGRVAEAAEASGGAEAAAAWWERVRRASHPWLFATPRRPVLIRDWIDRNVPDPTAKADARRIVAEWATQRAGCDDTTIGLVVEARSGLGRIVHPRSDFRQLGGGRAAEIFNALLRVSGEAEQLDRAAEASLTALVPSGERGRMRADIRVAARRRP